MERPRRERVPPKIAPPRPGLAVAPGPEPSQTGLMTTDLDFAPEPELIRKLPKTDLHLHLDGSLRLSTLLELAREREVELPSWTEEGLLELVFKESYRSLPEYLEGFRFTTAVLQDKEAMERTAYELALDNQAEGVRYIEVRFAPQLHIHTDFTAQEVLLSVDRGLRRAMEEFNARPAVREGREPPFRYGIIVCALRFFTAGFSSLFRHFILAHKFSEPQRVFALASLELARMTTAFLEEHPEVPIVGIDLAGKEKGYPARDHWEAFQHAHQRFLGKTVHAGEAYGPESIFQAITELHADRIGHGTWLLDPSKVTNPEILDPEAYVANLVRFIADRRITMEICLTSNLQTSPTIPSLEAHPFKKMLDNKLSTTFCTDNRLVSRTTVTQEISKAVKAFGIDVRRLRNLLVYGFKRSFFPGPYTEKRAYVRQVIDYFDQVVEEHQGSRGGKKKPRKTGRDQGGTK